ncbi:FHA domain-containing protein [Streptomyces microflavus]|uniref:FHA domain-containing protein n=1 Tax=Streptomyces microflavus TaxID=1919 RepID=UPI003333B0A8
MPTCPNGHQSGSEDWCEVCGHRMTGTGAPAGAVPPPPPPPPAPGYGYPPPAGNDGGPPTMQAELCPQCRTPREANAPYCEECRWNFLTNTATSYTPLAPQHGTPGGPGGPGGPPPGLNLPPGFLSQQGPGGSQQGPGGQGGQGGPGGQGGQGGPGGPGGGSQQHDPFEFQASRPSQMNRPAEPLAPERTGPGGQDERGGQGGQGGPPPHAFQQGPPPPPAFQQQGPPPHQQQSAPSPFERQQSAPSPFEPQQSSPFEPQQSSPFPPQQQHSAPPQQQSPHGGGGDDWVLPPPSQAQAPQPPQAFQQQAPYQGGQQGGQQGPGGRQGGHPDQHQGNQGYGQDQGYGQAPGQGQPQQAASWTAVIAPDREYFLAMMQRSGPEATGLNLPAYSPEQRLPLTGTQVTIGRRRHSTGESPDIDLSVPPEDPGVSHQHAVLVQQPDGGWAVVDQKSTNGTTLNGAEEPIQPYVPVPLQDGDQVHVGAWTTITIRRD